MKDLFALKASLCSGKQNGGLHVTPGWPVAALCSIRYHQSDPQSLLVSSTTNYCWDSSAPQCNSDFLEVEDRAAWRNMNNGLGWSQVCNEIFSRFTLISDSMVTVSSIQTVFYVSCCHCIDLSCSISFILLLVWSSQVLVCLALLQIMHLRCRENCSKFSFCRGIYCMILNYTMLFYFGRGVQ